MRPTVIETESELALPVPLYGFNFNQDFEAHWPRPFKRHGFTDER